MKDRDIHAAIRILRHEVPKWETPIVTLMAETYESPFRVLISCILSLRTQDSTTAKASHRLFAVADTPQAMVETFGEKNREADLPRRLLQNQSQKYSRNLPDVESTNTAAKFPTKSTNCLKFKGVGRKTANLVVTLGYKKPGICVDTHVHRISNRWGYINTKTPEKTEIALRAKLPKQYWIEYNDLLVSFGQHCAGRSLPLCSQCPVKNIAANRRNH